MKDKWENCESMGQTNIPVLTEEQILGGYFDIVGGFPAGKNILKRLKDYDGADKICVTCTQMDSASWSNKKSLMAREKKQILNEWIDFLRTNTKALKALHFNSHVPQALFDAACCQENLEELRFKWGNYQDLSALENLRSLKFLYIGPGASVRDITPLTKMKSLVVLHVKQFKRIEDYSPLAALDNLEMLFIGSGTLQRIVVKDLEFLREMPNLLSFGTGYTTLRKKYTKDELTSLFSKLPNLRDMFINGKIYNKT